MRKNILFFILLLGSIALMGCAYLQPTFNGSDPGCSAGGCHVFKNGIVSVRMLDSVNVEVTLTGVSSGSAVAGELENSSGVVVDFINSTHNNPFVLTATDTGYYRINAGFKKPSRYWDSASVHITKSLKASPDSGWQSNIVITEIMFDIPKDIAGDANGDGHRGSHSDEFIELYNKDSVSTDISGYEILDRASVPVFTFPANSILNSHQFAVVFGAVGTAGFGNNIPAATLKFAVHPNDDNNDGFDYSGKSNFKNSGDNVILVNPAASDTLAEIYWGSSVPVTTKPIYLAYPNTLSGGKISGAIGQSVTHSLDNILWDTHTLVSSDTSNLFSPGYNVEKVTQVKYNNKIAENFKLMQNYPNPFNPSTTISYMVPNNSFVEVSIFNTVGEKISTLVSEQQSAGYHSVKFSANQLSSGVYLYRLKSEDFVEIRKMILLK